MIFTQLKCCSKQHKLLRWKVYEAFRWSPQGISTPVPGPLHQQFRMESGVSLQFWVNAAQSEDKGSLGTGIAGWTWWETQDSGLRKGPLTFKPDKFRLIQFSSSLPSIGFNFVWKWATPKQLNGLGNTFPIRSSYLAGMFSPSSTANLGQNHPPFSGGMATRKGSVLYGLGVRWVWQLIGPIWWTYWMLSLGFFHI